MLCNSFRLRVESGESNNDLMDFLPVCFVGAPTSDEYPASNGHVGWLLDIRTHLSKRRGLDDSKNTALGYAARGNHLPLIEELLEVPTSESLKLTKALCGACVEGHLELVKHLVEEKQADVTWRDTYGHSPLGYAALGYHCDVIRYLWQNGACAFKDPSGVLGAALGGHTDLLQYLKNVGAKLTGRNKHGLTALTYAGRGGHRDAVDWLLDNGVPMPGSNALMGAAETGQGEMVEFLISRGAGVNDRENNGLSVLSHAARGGHQDVVELLLQHGADLRNDCVLCGPALAGRIDMAKFLISKGADVNATDACGNTAVVYASRWVFTDFIDLLLENGAALDARMLFPAARGGKTDIIKYLHDRRFDLSWKSEKPLSYGEGQGTIAAQQILFNSFGRSAFHEASSRGQLGFIKALMDKNAALDKSEALHGAVLGGHNEAVELLLRSGASIDEKDGSGLRPVDIAAQFHRTQIAECFARFRSIEAAAYFTRSPQRGSLLIINNNFTGDSERHGAKRDVDTLECVFKRLGFQVVIKEDCTISELCGAVYEFTKSGINASVYAVAVMSHGDAEGISCKPEPDSTNKNFDPFPIENIFRIVEQSSELKGKPKLFIVQACRGDESMVGTAKDTEKASKVFCKKPKKTTKDSLIAYATQEGYTARRDPVAGSWFIQELCSSLRTKAHLLPLQDIVEKVRWDVWNKYEGWDEQLGRRVKMLSDVRHGMRHRKLFLNPPFSELLYGEPLVLK